MTHTPSAAAADAPADRFSPGRSGHFPPLASQDELDRDWPSGWWILPFAAIGLVLWYFIIRALADWFAAIVGAVL